MKKKHDAKKSGKPEKKSEAVVLLPEEANELQMILDRLAVQDPEGGSLENYLTSLRQALAERAHMMAGLLELLSRDPSKVGFKAFELLRDVATKKYSRIVKQAAYRFSQRGYVTRSETPAAEKVVLIQREVREPIAHMSRMDSSLWLLSAIIPESEARAPRAVVAYAEDGFKSVRAVVNESSYRSYKEYVSGVIEHLAEKRPYEVPLRHLARLFFEMLEYRGGDSHPSVEQARRVLTPYHDPESKPYAFELMPEVEHPELHLDEVDAPAVVEGVDVSWLYFSKSEVIPYKQKLDELDSPVLVVPPEVQKERSLELLKRAGNELCTRKVRDRFRRFFEEQALWLKLAGKEELALMAWIVARHLGSEAEAGENPVVARIFISSLQRDFPEQFKPTAREEAPSGEGPYQHRSESGLILP